MAEFEAAGRAAFAVDMPGFGHADPCSRGSIMPQLDAFVDAMLTDAGGPVMLMGNSLGACASLGAASRRTSRRLVRYSRGHSMSEGTTARLGDEKFVSLRTFKRNGDAVVSPMWIARDGDQLLAWTPADAWKVKRIRRDPRVTLRPCGRTGKVRAGQPLLAGTAEVITDPSEVARVESLIKHKYGLEFRVVGPSSRCGAA
jgi:PPOX class probable F420-dependent enzyme